ncbi:MAG: hypothetical protein MUC60_17455 [Oscillatoria sp. Prado101]|nr:hypothetical protein [Oscillatoria sp. Prado101]
MPKPFISSKIGRCNRRCAHRHPQAAPNAVRVSACAVRRQGQQILATPHSAGAALRELEKGHPQPNWPALLEETPSPLAARAIWHFGRRFCESFVRLQIQYPYELIAHQKRPKCHCAGWLSQVSRDARQPEPEMLKPPI